jgi:hypothetical protein
MNESPSFSSRTPHASPSRFTRRRVLKVVGGLGLAAVTGTSLRAWQVGLLGATDAYELWDEWAHGTLTDIRLLAAAAVLASNPHNSQPWRLRRDGTAIEIHVDPTRALGPVDPVLRQMYLGAGCAIENAIAAARGLGLDLDVESGVSVHGTRTCRLALSGTVPAETRHFEAIARRHTHRGAYLRDRPLDADRVAALLAQVTAPDTRLWLHAAGSGEGHAIADAIIDATRWLIADATFMSATDRWFRMTPREVAEHRDGPSLRTAGLGRLAQAGAALGPRPRAGASHATWLRATIEQHLATTPMLGVVGVRDAGARDQQVAAGRLWQRVHLEATALDLAAQPLDQLLEKIDRERELGIDSDSPRVAASVIEAGWTPMLMFRIGHAIDRALPSARRELDSFFDN